MRKQLTEKEEKLAFIQAVMKGNIQKAQELATVNKPYKMVEICKERELVTFDGKTYSFIDWASLYTSIQFDYNFILWEETLTYDSDEEI